MGLKAWGGVGILQGKSWTAVISQDEGWGSLEHLGFYVHKFAE